MNANSYSFYNHKKKRKDSHLLNGPNDKRYKGVFRSVCKVLKRLLTTVIAVFPKAENGLTTGILLGFSMG